MKSGSFFTGWMASLHNAFRPDAISKKNQFTLLGLILLGCLAIRLLTIGAPSLDRTAWKEIDYLMISSNFWQNGFNFFWPEVSWPATPPRVTEMELPLVPYTAALFYQLLGYHALSARLVTLIAFLVMIIFVFKLAKRELGPLPAVAAALAAAVMPLYHPFSRFLLSEPTTITASIVTLYYMAEWVDHERRRDAILAGVMLALTISLKIETLYIGLPILWIAFRKYGWQWRRYTRMVMIGLASLLLPIGWYIYAAYLEQIGANVFGIFGGHNKFQTVTMLTNPGWYREIARRMIFEILGGWLGVILALSGIGVLAWLRKGGLFFAHLLSFAIYVVLVAEGHLDANYRQLASLPSLTVFAGFGALALGAAVPAFFSSTVRSVKVSWRPVTTILATSFALLLLLIPFRLQDIQGQTEAPYHLYKWYIAQILDDYTDENSKLVVAGEYTIHVGGNDLSPVLYHYSGLQGWTLEEDGWQLERVEQLVDQGATTFVALAPENAWERAPYLYGEDFITAIRQRYQVVYDDPNNMLLIAVLR